MNESSLVLKFRHPLPKRIWIFGIAAAVATFVAWLKRPTVAAINYEWAAVAFLLGMFALISLRRWTRRSYHLELTEDGLWDRNTEEFIPTDQLDAIITDPRDHDMRVPVPGDRDVAIMYSTRKIIIPRKIPGRGEWLQILVTQMKSRIPEMKLSGELLNHYREELKMHGPAAVHVYKELGTSANLRLRKPWFADLLVALVLTLTLPAALRSDFVNFGSWEDFAVVPVFVALIVVLMLFETVSRSSRKGPLGAIIVSPGTIAVDHNRVKGAASWAEVGKVNCVGEMRVLTLQLSGASIMVMDVFDERLKEIHPLILRYRIANKSEATSEQARPL